MSFANLAKSWHLYVIADEHLSGGKSHAEIARQAIAGGADVIQLRDKTASSRELYEAGQEIRRITREAGVIFIVNDRLDITMASDADGLHLGQEDFPAKVARQYLGKKKILGVSAASLTEALQAEADGADYLGVGPVFEARSTKADAGAPRGLSLITEIRQTCALPLIAIGGINQNNVGQVIHAGADGVAVISAIVAAEDVEIAAREIKKLVLREKGIFNG